MTITGGTITASGDSGAGIGAGCSAAGNASVGRIKITAGVFSIDSQEGSGIGAGYAQATTQLYTAANVGTLTIAGGNFTIRAAIDGAGIGAGFTEGGNATVGTLSIRDGIFDIAADLLAAAAIGAGSATGGGSRVDTLQIENGTFALRGYSAFGTAGTLTFGASGASRVVFTAVTAGRYVMKANETVFASGAVRRVANAAWFFATPARASGGSFYGQYTVDAAREAIVGGFSLQLGTTGFSGSGYQLVIRNAATGFEETVPFLGAGACALLTTLPAAGTYTIEMINSQGQSLGNLKSGSSSSFEVDDDQGAAGFVPAPTGDPGDRRPPRATRSAAVASGDQGGGLGAGTVAGIVVAVIGALGGAFCIYWFVLRSPTDAASGGGRRHKIDEGCMCLSPEMGF